MSDPRPIAVFDSGVGGLTVAREIRTRMPGEHLLYLADTAWVPYGGRPLEEIRERAAAVGSFLQEQGAKALVVACNTASGAGLETLRAALEIPVVGVEPAVKPAAAATRNRRIGVMATEAMLRADRFRRLVDRYAADIELHAQACPGLVEFVEAGDTDSAAVRERLTMLLEPLRSAGVDTVVLGCTHYPLLRSAIAETMGPEVALLDSGEAVARQTERVLEEAGALASSGSGGIQVLATGDATQLEQAVGRLWGESVPVRQVYL